MLNIEGEIDQDASGQARDQLLAYFSDQAARIKRAIDAGVSPSEYRCLSQLVTAYDAAGVVVNKVWQQTHGAGALHQGGWER